MPSRALVPNMCAKCKVLKSEVKIINISYCHQCLVFSVRNKFRANIHKASVTSFKLVVPVDYGSLDRLEASLVLLHLFQSYPLEKFQIFPVAITSSNHAADSTFEKQLLDFLSKNIFSSDCGWLHEKLVILSSASTINHVDDATINSGYESSILPYRQLRQLVEYTKNELKADAIVLSDSMTNLACKVFTMTCFGRGSSLPYELGLVQVIDSISLIRPMRDLSDIEISHYSTINNLPMPRDIMNNYLTDSMRKEFPRATIESVTRDFLQGLASDFPATTSTIVRTAFKIPALKGKECKLCSGPILDSDCDSYCFSCTKALSCR